MLHCDTAIGVACRMPFLGVSSLNFGPLATAAFFLARTGEAPIGRLFRRGPRSLQGRPEGYSAAIRRGLRSPPISWVTVANTSRNSRVSSAKPAPLAMLRSSM